MGFFDELGKKISDASQDVMQKGKEMADTAKFNSMIHDEEKKITAVYSKIGKKYFEDFKNAPAEGFKDEIHAAQAKIAEIQEKLNALKNEGKAAAEAAATEAKETLNHAADAAKSAAEGAAEAAKSTAEGAADAAGQAVSKVENAVENAVNENQSTEQ